MPVLAWEPDCYPADLWQCDDQREHRDHRWWCLHTLPRQEKMVARHLRSRGVWHYLPQVVRETRTPAGRKVRSLHPLFPGYLFLLANEPQRVEALKGKHLANVLEVTDQASLVHDLKQIHQLLAPGLPVVPDPVYPIGTRVRIMSGPLLGLEGTIVRRHGCRDRFVAVVRFLGSGATIELADWQVEQIGGPDPQRLRG